MDQRVAQRYALALIDLGQQSGMDRTASDMQAIRETIIGSRELQTLLGSPVVKPEAKLRVLEEIFERQVSLHVMAFIRLLVKKGREAYLDAIAVEFQHLMDLRQGILRASVTSATELRDFEQREILSKLEHMTGKKIHPQFSIDPAIRGGFIARVGDTLIDASLQRQLDRLREQFKHGGSPSLN